MADKPDARTHLDLVERARKARTAAYEPYSDFAVGAAIETTAGDVYTGCNIENINFTNTIHAEQTALVKAVSEGHAEFERLAIAVQEPLVPPCGLCRQALAEFCDDDFTVIVGGVDGDDFETYSLGYLLPESMNTID